MKECCCIGYSILMYRDDIITSSALSGKMLIVRIVKNNKIDDYFRAG